MHSTEGIEQPHITENARQAEFYYLNTLGSQTKLYQASFLIESSVWSRLVIQIGISLLALLLKWQRKPI